MRRTVMLAAAIVVVGMAAGCSSGGADSSPTDGPGVLVAEHPSDATREAAISGTVDLSGDCFVLRGEGGDWLIEWPHGSARGEDPLSVDVPEFGTVYAGQYLTASGGYSADSDGCAVDGLQGTAQIDLLTRVSTASPAP